MTHTCPLRPAALFMVATLTACAASVKAPPPPLKQNSAPPTAAATLSMAEAGSMGTGTESEIPKLNMLNPYKPITIRVTGSGAAPYSKSLTPSQRKLLALRAAKLDAFRAIAEQIQGLKLVGNSSVANMTTVSDSFRTYVDGYLRGVNILSVKMEPDGTSRAVAEITLDKDFYKTFKRTLERASAPQESAIVGTVTETASRDSNDTSSASPYASNYYLSQ